MVDTFFRKYICLMWCTTEVIDSCNQRRKWFNASFSKNELCRAHSVAMNNVIVSPFRFSDKNLDQMVTFNQSMPDINLMLLSKYILSFFLMNFTTAMMNIPSLITNRNGPSNIFCQKIFESSQKPFWNRPNSNLSIRNDLWKAHSEHFPKKILLFLTTKNKDWFFFNCNWILFKGKCHWFLIQLNLWTFRLEFLCEENEGGVDWCAQLWFDEKCHVALTDATTQKCYSRVGCVVNVLDAVDWIRLWSLKQK